MLNNRHYNGAVVGAYGAWGGLYASNMTATAAANYCLSSQWVQYLNQPQAGAMHAAAMHETERQLRTEYEAEQQRAQARVQVIADEADKKAEALLLAHLDPSQRVTWTRERYFEVRTAGGLYRLYKGWAGNVALLGEDQKEIRRYCIHPQAGKEFRVPHAENLLSQKFMLEIEEAEFLRVANRHPPREDEPLIAYAA